MKIICIGRNYIDHAKELNNPVPSEPIFFLKPDSSILPSRTAFYIPDFSDDVHFEVELVYKICKLGKHISVKHAERYYDEIGQHHNLCPHTNLYPLPPRGSSVGDTLVPRLNQIKRWATS